MIDQAILAVKIKAAEDRLSYLRSLLPPSLNAVIPETTHADGIAGIFSDAANAAPVFDVNKRKPGRPRKAA